MSQFLPQHESAPRGWLLYRQTLGEIAVEDSEKIRAETLVIAGLREPSQASQRPQPEEWLKLREKLETLDAGDVAAVRSVWELADQLEGVHAHKLADETALLKYLDERIGEVNDVTVWGGAPLLGFNHLTRLHFPRLEYACFVLAEANGWLDRQGVYGNDRPNRTTAGNIREALDQMNELRRWLGGVVKDAGAAGRVGEVTAETPADAADPISIETAARICGVSTKTMRNKMSEARSNGNAPPEPIAGQSGQKIGLSFREFYPWLKRQYPTASIPADYAEICRIAAAQSVELG